MPIPSRTTRTPRTTRGSHRGSGPRAGAGGRRNPRTHRSTPPNPRLRRRPTRWPPIRWGWRRRTPRRWRGPRPRRSSCPGTPTTPRPIPGRVSCGRPTSRAIVADAGGTPAAWRIAAAAALGGGLWVGFASEDRRGVRLPVMALLGGGLATVIPIARAGRRPPIAPRALLPAGPNSRGPTFTVVIAGRDEAAVLPRLLADLGRQDHRAPDGPLCEVIVIDDRSTDGTGAVAADAARKAG